MLRDRGFTLYATPGTTAYLREHNIDATTLHWPDEDAHPNIMDYLRERKIDLVVNIPKNLSRSELANDYTIRRSAVDFNIPLITNARLASAFIYAICKYDLEDLAVKSWDEY
jgi:carbamoyl-phosphate synthase large subunit